ncbi:MAG: Ig-like domain-containing protein, partial [Deltaproteobacteria bacterium]|nr:Ig-like domain-containing protein [Deltaproteobacteria bacterium]
FVAKLNSSGVRQWNTFMGGTGSDAISKLALYLDGSIYVAGLSSATWGSPINPFTPIVLSDPDAVESSPDNPLLGFQLSYNAFAAKLNSSGVLQWNTFLGLSTIGVNNAAPALPAVFVNLFPYPATIALDISGYIYIGGKKTATWGSPIIPYAGNNDGFVGKLDYNPPIVLSNSPASGSIDMATNVAATATFNKPLNVATVNSATFTLVSSQGQTAAGTVTYDAATKTATFTPTSSLANSTNYTATLTTGIQDTGGNALAANYSWNFTTVSPGATPAPGGNDTSDFGGCFIYSIGK